MRKRPNAINEPTLNGERANLRERLGTALRQTRTLLLASAVLIGLLALLYLHTVGEVALANNQLQTLNDQHARLLRQDQELHQQLGEATSPAFIGREARALGFAPALPLPAPPISPSVRPNGIPNGAASAAGVRP